MRRSAILPAALALTLMAFAGVAAARDVVIGVNVYDEGATTPAQQDAEVDRLKGYGVKAIRTGVSGKLGVSLPDTIAFLRSPPSGSRGWQGLAPSDRRSATRTAANRLTFRIDHGDAA